MERRQGNGIYAMIGAAAVVVVAFLVGALYWNAPSNGKSVDIKSVDIKSVNTRSGNGSPAADSGRTAAGDDTKSPAVDGSAGKPAVHADASAADAREPGAASQVPESAGPKDKPVENGKTPDAPQAVPARDTAPKPPVDAGKPAAEKPDAKSAAPSFDHVRIEPSGENVFAGRVTPGATIEMVLGGEVYARAVADPSGLFALVAPPLPVGASHIYLRSIAPDGRREVSRESVTVMISRDKTRRPLVVLASPDKPTVVLSNPDSPDGRKPDNANEGTATGGKPAARPEVQIVSIEARDDGRLFVSCLAAPGATVKLYINGALVAPGGADSEGRLSFAIARGMEAGDYQVRLDDVDPVSGHVKSKAEVKFNIPVAENHPAETDMPRSGATGLADRQPDARTPGPETVTVSRGDNLWRISERRYGSGYLYLEVYDANMRKIRNPDMIYPGQVLVLPPLDTPPKP